MPIVRHMGRFSTPQEIQAAITNGTLAEPFIAVLTADSSTTGWENAGVYIQESSAGVPSYNYIPYDSSTEPTPGPGPEPEPTGDPIELLTAINPVRTAYSGESNQHLYAELLFTPTFTAMVHSVEDASGNTAAFPNFVFIKKSVFDSVADELSTDSSTEIVYYILTHRGDGYSVAQRTNNQAGAYDTSTSLQCTGLYYGGEPIDVPDASTEDDQYLYVFAAYRNPNDQSEYNYYENDLIYELGEVENTPYLVSDPSGVLVNTVLDGTGNIFAPNLQVNVTQNSVYDTFEYAAYDDETRAIALDDHFGAQEYTEEQAEAYLKANVYPNLEWYTVEIPGEDGFHQWGHEIYFNEYEPSQLQYVNENHPIVIARLSNSLNDVSTGYFEAHIYNSDWSLTLPNAALNPISDDEIGTASFHTKIDSSYEQAYDLIAVGYYTDASLQAAQSDPDWTDASYAGFYEQNVRNSYSSDEDGTLDSFAMADEETTEIHGGIFSMGHDSSNGVYDSEHVAVYPFAHYYAGLYVEAWIDSLTYSEGNLTIEVGAAEEYDSRYKYKVAVYSQDDYDAAAEDYGDPLPDDIYEELVNDHLVSGYGVFGQEETFDVSDFVEPDTTYNVAIVSWDTEEDRATVYAYKNALNAVDTFVTESE